MNAREHSQTRSVKLLGLSSHTLTVAPCEVLVAFHTRYSGPPSVRMCNMWYPPAGQWAANSQHLSLSLPPLCTEAPQIAVPQRAPALLAPRLERPHPLVQTSSPSVLSRAPLAAQRPSRPPPAAAPFGRTWRPWVGHSPGVDRPATATARAPRAGHGRWPWMAATRAAAAVRCAAESLQLLHGMTGTRHELSMRARRPWSVRVGRAAAAEA